MLGCLTRSTPRSRLTTPAAWSQAVVRSAKQDGPVIWLSSLGDLYSLYLLFSFPWMQPKLPSRNTRMPRDWLAFDQELTLGNCRNVRARSVWRRCLGAHLFIACAGARKTGSPGPSVNDELRAPEAHSGGIFRPRRGAPRIHLPPTSHKAAARERRQPGTSGARSWAVMGKRRFRLVSQASSAPHPTARAVGPIHQRRPLLGA